MSSSETLLAESCKKRGTEHVASADADGPIPGNMKVEVVASSSLDASHSPTRTQSWRNGMPIHSCIHCERVVVDVQHQPHYLPDKVLGGEILKSGSLGVTYSYARNAIESGCSLFAYLLSAKRDGWWDQIVAKGKEHCFISYELRRIKGEYFLIVILGAWLNYCAGESMFCRITAW